MTENQLETYVRNFLKRNYDLELTVPVEINNRLTRSLGRFTYKRGRKEPVAIQFSKHLIATENIGTITDVARHEAIHYALYMLDKPHKDGEEYFEKELIKHKSSPTRSFRVEYKSYHLYTCSCHEFKKARALRKNRTYYCKVCKGELKYHGKRTS